MKENERKERSKGEIKEGRQGLNDRRILKEETEGASRKDETKKRAHILGF